MTPISAVPTPPDSPPSSIWSLARRWASLSRSLAVLSLIMASTELPTSRRSRSLHWSTSIRGCGSSRTTTSRSSTATTLIGPIAVASGITPATTAVAGFEHMCSRTGFALFTGPTATFATVHRRGLGGRRSIGCATTGRGRLPTATISADRLIAVTAVHPPTRGVISGATNPPTRGVISGATNPPTRGATSGAAWPHVLPGSSRRCSPRDRANPPTGGATSGVASRLTRATGGLARRREPATIAARSRNGGSDHRWR